MFVALYPTPPAHAHLETALSDIRENLSPEQSAAVRWIPPERWHITLAFLAIVDPTRVEWLQRSLAEVAAEHAPLVDLNLTGSGAFGSTVWMGVAPTERGSAAERLAKVTQRASTSCGVEVERRPWRAHLSIARLRGDRGEVRQVTMQLTWLLRDYDGPLWTADTFTLVNSILGPQPYHIPVGTFALGERRLSEPG